MPDDKISLKFNADDEISNAIDKLLGKLGGLGSAIVVANQAFQLLQQGIHAVSKAFDVTIGAAAESQEIMNRLANAIDLTGTSYNLAKPEIDAFLKSMMDTTRYGDEEMAGVLQEMITLTGDYQESLKGARLAADLASTGLFNLQSATTYIGQAIAGNTERLGRYIPELRASAGLINDNMSASEKWAVVQDVLTEKVGGMAQGELQTYNGQMARLKNQIGELGEFVGGPFLSDLTDMMSGLADVSENINTLSANTENLREVLLGFSESGGSADAFVKALSNIDQAISLVAEGAKLISNVLILPKLISPGSFEWIDKLIAFLESPPPPVPIWRENPVTVVDDLNYELEELNIKLLSLTEPAEALRQSITLYESEITKVKEGTKEWYDLKIKLVEAEQKLYDLGIATFDAMGQQVNSGNTLSSITADIYRIRQAESKEIGLQNNLATEQVRYLKEQSNQLASQIKQYAGPLTTGINNAMQGLARGQRAYKDMADFIKQVGAQLIIMGVNLLINYAIDQLALSVKKKQIVSQVGLATGLAIQLGEEIAIIAALKTQLALRIALRVASGGILHGGGFLGFHSGGVIPKAHGGIFASDERLILAQTGEAVINRRATSAIGGRQAIDYINSTGQLPTRTGAGGNTIVINIGNFIGEETWVKNNLIPIIEKVNRLRL